MKTSRMLLAFALAAAPALAQHSHHGAPSSPYAGQQYREIKALSAEEVRGFQNGAGMGFARTAELNRHPGPLHALEHRRALDLTEEQALSLGSLLTRHKERARALGERVVELERELDALFAGGKADAASVDRLTAAIAEATGRLRAEHLKTHLETSTILTPAQVARYESVRGYASAAQGQHPAGHDASGHGASGHSPGGHATGRSPSGHGASGPATGQSPSGHGTSGHSTGSHGGSPTGHGTGSHGGSPAGHGTSGHGTSTSHGTTSHGGAMRTPTHGGSRGH